HGALEALPLVPPRQVSHHHQRAHDDHRQRRPRHRSHKSRRHRLHRRRLRPVRRLGRNGPAQRPRQRPHRSPRPPEPAADRAPAAGRRLHHGPRDGVAVCRPRAAHPDAPPRRRRLAVRAPPRDEAA
ncbi:hypothetical protein BN1708_019533, partial [Verticillium longisporum]